MAADMSGGFPMLGLLSNGSSYNNASPPTRPAQLTVPASNNTKPTSFDTIAASLSSDTSALLMRILFGGNAPVTWSVDLAVGAAASEQIFLADFFYGSEAAGTDFQAANILLPVSLPSGARISARYQTSNTNSSIFLGLTGFDGGFTQSAAGLIDAIGFTAASTTGTSLTPGASGAKGSFSQLIASTAVDYAGFFVNVDGSGQASAASIQIDIAVGSGNNIILPDYLVRSTGGFPTGTNSGFFPIFIPAASRISARVANDVSTAVPITLNAVRQ